MSNRPRLAVLSPSPIPSFARQDAQLLSSAFEVEAVAVAGLRSIGRLKAAIGRADAILVWFMGRNALLPILMARARIIPIVSVIGGFEVAWVKALKYGIRPGTLKERVLRRLLIASDAIISVSRFSSEEALRRFPEYESKLVLIPNAVDTALFNMGSHKLRSGVANVGMINRKTIELKSIRLFVETARRMPDVPFTLIGPATDRAAREFVQTLPSNVTWLGRLPHDTIAEKLQTASVYFQASVYESFSVAMAEAMSCGCFPVISNNAALPEVAGPTATVLHDLTPESAEIAIRTALIRPEIEREATRLRIVEHFGTQRRKETLIATIQTVIHQSRR